MASKKDKFVIGLTGSVGSGCTTLSKVIEQSGFLRISISDRIKEKFREIHGKEPTKDSYGPDWRYELQSIGNRGRRGEFSETKLSDEKAKSFWVDLAINKANEIITMSFWQSNLILLWDAD